MLRNIILVWITLSAVILRDSTAADLKNQQRLAAVFAECKISESATDSDLLKLKIAGSVKTPAVKCLSTCISEKMGIISNRQLNVEGVMKLLRSAGNDEKVIHSVNEIIAECKKIRESDRCEYGSKVMDCINDGGLKRGITM
ncbi:general odorant-binding protein 19d-like [Bradysia coprophila]|uniref:general odorant-binding protein 19d-like n=1 Tax=Bradysia coprophila TaxID=38358 RepID=UPI00187D84EC|nr:general odorant-binding protein 19d-like [Bradysia coprophila]